MLTKYYLCDHSDYLCHANGKPCSYPECRYTADLAHAKHPDTTNFVEVYGALFERDVEVSNR